MHKKQKETMFSYSVMLRWVPLTRVLLCSEKLKLRITGGYGLLILPRRILQKVLNKYK